MQFPRKGKHFFLYFIKKASVPPEMGTDAFPTLFHNYHTRSNHSQHLAAYGMNAIHDALTLTFARDLD